MSTAATEIGDIRAGTQPFWKAVCHRQDHVDQRCVEHLAALLGHQLVEPRIFAIRHPAALLEAADHLLLDFAEQKYVLGKQCHRLDTALQLARDTGMCFYDAELPAARPHPTQTPPPAPPTSPPPSNLPAARAPPCSNCVLRWTISNYAVSQTDMVRHRRAGRPAYGGADPWVAAALTFGPF
jgi:hypothetical protein